MSLWGGGYTTNILKSICTTDFIFPNDEKAWLFIRAKVFYSRQSVIL